MHINIKVTLFPRANKATFIMDIEVIAYQRTQDNLTIWDLNLTSNVLWEWFIWVWLCRNNWHAIKEIKSTNKIGCSTKFKVLMRNTTQTSILTILQVQTSRSVWNLMWSSLKGLKLDFKDFERGLMQEQISSCMLFLKDNKRSYVNVNW